MKAVTLRNVPPDLVRTIRRRAIDKGLSINKAVIDLLAEGAGSRGAKSARRFHDDLDELADSWTKEEAAEFERALSEQRGIDPRVWN